MIIVHAHELNFELWRNFNLLSLKRLQAVIRHEPGACLNHPSSAFLDRGTVRLMPWDHADQLTIAARLDWFARFLEGSLHPFSALAGFVGAPQLKQAARTIAAALAEDLGTIKASACETALIEAATMVRDASRAGPSSPWTQYLRTCAYTAPDHRTKTRFVADAIGEIRPRRLIDLGANVGEYALLVAGIAAEVIAVDADRACIDLSTEILPRDVSGSVTPLVVDLNPDAVGIDLNENPAPEQRPFHARANSDAFLALALLHHLCLFQSRTIDTVVGFLANFGSSGIIEWISLDDLTVRRRYSEVSARVAEVYTQVMLEEQLQRWFRIRRICPLASGTRTLYYLGARDE